MALQKQNSLWFTALIIYNHSTNGSITISSDSHKLVLEPQSAVASLNIMSLTKWWIRWISTNTAFSRGRYARPGWWTLRPGHNQPTTFLTSMADLTWKQMILRNNIPDNWEYRQLFTVPYAKNGSRERINAVLKSAAGWRPITHPKTAYADRQKQRSVISNQYNNINRTRSK